MPPRPAATKSATKATPATPVGNQMPTRVTENEQQSGAKIGSGLAATGDTAVRVEGTDPKNNADTELGKNSAGYATGAPGSFGKDVRGTDAEALSKDGAYQNESVDSIEGQTVQDPRAALAIISYRELADRFAKLEARVTELEEAKTAPTGTAGTTLTINPLNAEVGSMERALKRAGIQPHPELDELEIKREREEQEKAAAEPAQVE